MSCCFSGNLDALSSFWIAANPRISGVPGETAKTPDFGTVARDQAIPNTIKDDLDAKLDVYLGESGEFIGELED
ncbi:hypothetical protein ZMTM_22020 [Methyloradius palustris]|uniref:Uncharacterized protein n=1 Tax=Methyloradius palustris TaxID=2778876 RepID=A0A8D5G4R7_9PROT|nr:hypothetical protein ZMTM_22020 [Methyloradius palustris]